MAFEFTSKLKEALEVLAGFRGTDADRAVRVKELGAISREVVRRSTETLERDIRNDLEVVNGDIADAQQTANLAAAAAAGALAAAQAAQADYDGLSEYAGFKVQAGGAVSLLELFALSNPVQQLSLARIAADFIILDGSVGTEMLSVGLGRNLASNTNFQNGLRHWEVTGFGGIFTQSTVSVRPPGQTWAGATYPTIVIFQNGLATDGGTDFRARPLIDAGGGFSHGVPVEAGQWYEFSAKVSTHRCRADMMLFWYTAGGVFIRQDLTATLENAPGDSANPEAWNRYWVKGQAPANAAYCRAGVRKRGTSSGANSFVFIHKPMFAESSANASVPAAYSPDGTTLIDGGSIITQSVTATQLAAQSVTADKMAANSITAANAALGNAAVTTLKIAGQAVTFPQAAVGYTIPKQGHGGVRDILTLVATTSGTGPMLIEAYATIGSGVQNNSAATVIMELVIRRLSDGFQTSVFVPGQVSGVNDTFTPIMFYVWESAFGAATLQLTLRMSVTLALPSSGQVVDVLVPTIKATEFKR